MKSRIIAILLLLFALNLAAKFDYESKRQFFDFLAADRRHRTSKPKASSTNSKPSRQYIEEDEEEGAYETNPYNEKQNDKAKKYSDSFELFTDFPRFLETSHHGKNNRANERRLMTKNDRKDYSDKSFSQHKRGERQNNSKKSHSEDSHSSRRNHARIKKNMRKSHAKNRNHSQSSSEYHRHKKQDILFKSHPKFRNHHRHGSHDHRNHNEPNHFVKRVKSNKNSKRQPEVHRKYHQGKFSRSHSHRHHGHRHPKQEKSHWHRKCSRSDKSHHSSRHKNHRGVDDKVIGSTLNSCQRLLTLDKNQRKDQSNKSPKGRLYREPVEDPKAFLNSMTQVLLNDKQPANINKTKYPKDVAIVDLKSKKADSNKAKNIPQKPSKNNRKDSGSLDKDDKHLWEAHHPSSAQKSVFGKINFKNEGQNFKDLFTTPFNHTPKQNHDKRLPAQAANNKPRVSKPEANRKESRNRISQPYSH